MRTPWIGLHFAPIRSYVASSQDEDGHFTLGIDFFTLRVKFFTLHIEFFTLRVEFFTLRAEFFTLRVKC